jgi:GT2 family glycosyltransferase
MSFVTGRLRLVQPTQREVAVFDNDDPMVIDRSVVGSLGHGANLAVRREALESVGGFDERLGPGARWEAGEDLELIDRLLAAGCTGRYEPTVSGYHLQWRSTKELFGLEWRYGLGQGARLALLRKLDKERARHVARTSTWDLGVAEVIRGLLHGWEKIAARAAIRLAGTVVGFAGLFFTPARPLRAVQRR